MARRVKCVAQDHTAEVAELTQNTVCKPFNPVALAFIINWAHQCPEDKRIFYWGGFV